MYETDHQGNKLFIMRPGGHDIKKVVDFRLDNGKRYYKVKWESSWEPEDNLLDYQVFLDQFWDFVNRVKSDQNLLNQPQRKKPRIIITDVNNHFKSASTKFMLNTREHIESETVSLYKNSSLENSDNEHNDQVENGFFTQDPQRTSNLSKSTPQILIKTEHNEIPPDRPTMVGSLPEKFSPSRNSTNSRSNLNTMNTDLIQGKDEKNMLICDKKSHQCPQCGKIFKRRDVMIRHERTHTNNFCYFCSCCGRGFMRRYVLLKHLKREHNTEDQSKVLSTKVSKISSSPDVFIGYGSDVTLSENLGVETDVYKYMKNRNVSDDFIQIQTNYEPSEDDQKSLDEEDSEKSVSNKKSKDSNYGIDEQDETNLTLTEDGIHIPESHKNEAELFVLKSLSLGDNEEKSLIDKSLKSKNVYGNKKEEMGNQSLLVAIKNERYTYSQDLNSNPQNLNSQDTNTNFRDTL
ncbi:MDS1 and EVI1 complex locus protein EVI1-B isoform X3 [Hydra vulgaris]|uniref:MDS1 and EVI1 complex locus protein EVI1-B isoform X3 n=1 Tax=Hydra vulgaris TaxID=6087 RepID=A0ABM4B6Q7_HYDVU